MLAFIDSPIQLMVLLIILLVVFGPDKLPELGKQLGRALRELKRTTSDLTSSLHMDDFNTSHNPPRYDSYGNSYESYSNPAPLHGQDSWQPSPPETKTQAALSAPAVPHGDFAAAALADASADYGIGSSAPVTEHPAPTSAGVQASPEITPRPAEGTVPRNG